MGFINNNKVIVITPSDENGEEILSIIKNTLLDLGIEDIESATNFNEIWSSIKSVSFIIVDVSNQDSDRMYELGKLVSLRIPIVLLINKQSTKKLPPDLYSHTFIVYDLQDLQSLSEKLKKISESLVVNS